MTQTGATLPTRPAGRQRDPAREAAILDATAELLEEVGYAALTYEGVATRARASRSTLYRWWRGKPELVVAALHRRLDGEVRVPDTGSLRGDLVVLLDAYAGSGAASRKGALLAGLVHAMQTDAALREVVLNRVVVLDDTTVTGVVVRRALGRGELSGAVDARVLTRVMTAVLFLRTLVEATPLDDRWVREAVDGVLVPVLTAAQR